MSHLHLGLVRLLLASHVVVRVDVLRVARDVVLPSDICVAGPALVCVVGRRVVGRSPVCVEGGRARH